MKKKGKYTPLELSAIMWLARILLMTNDHLAL